MFFDVCTKFIIASSEGHFPPNFSTSKADSNFLYFRVNSLFCIDLAESNFSGATNRFHIA